MQRTHYNPVSYDSTGQKQCCSCRLFKPVADYARNRQNPDGLYRECKVCSNASRRRQAHAQGIIPRTPVRSSEQKRCSECRRWKPFAEFHSDCTNKDGRSHRCALCDCERARQQRRSKPGYSAKASRNAYQSSIQRRLRQLLKNRIWWALKGAAKSATTLRLLGCTLDEFKRHLESHFAPGMSWDNYGRYGWHIGHVRDCCSFDLTVASEQRQAFHFTNMVPQWAQDNWRKPRDKRKDFA